MMESGQGRWFPRQAFAVCPLVPVALWLIIGIVAATVPALTHLDYPTVLLAILPAGAVLFAVSPGRSRRLAAFAVFGVGIALLHLAAPWQTYASHLPRPVCGGAVRAVVVDRGAASESEIWPEGRAETEIRLLAVRTSARADWRRCSGKVVLRRFDRQRLPYGATIEAHGRFVLVDDPLPGAAFNYQRYLRTRGIGHVFETADVVVLREARGLRRLLAGLQSLRAACARRLVAGIKDERNARMLTAMTLGYRDGLDPDTRDSFVRGGAVHIFAISGLHVGISASILVLLMRLIRMPYRWQYALIPILLAVYVYLTGGAASAVRAWLMISIWSVSKSLYRQGSPVNAVAAAAVVLVVWNPLVIFQPGFQFSFIIVTVLVLGWPQITDGMSALSERPRWIPLRMRSGRPATVRRWSVSCLFRLTGCSGLAWLAGAGLVAYYSNLIIPGAFLVNIGMSVLAYLGLVGAVVKVSVGALGIRALDTACAWGVERVLSATRLLAASGDLSGAAIVVARPLLGVVLLYYVLLVCWLLLPGSIRRLRMSAATAMAMLLVLTALLPRLRGAPRVTVLHGDGEREPVVVIEPGYARPPVIVYGAHSSRTARNVASWLRRNGYTAARYCVLPSPRNPRSLPTHLLHARVAVESEILPSVTRLRDPWASSLVPRRRIGREASRAGARFDAADLTIQTLRSNHRAWHWINYDNAGVPIAVLIMADPNVGTRLSIRHGGRTSPEFHLPLSRRAGVICWMPRTGKVHIPLSDGQRRTGLNL